MVREMTWEEDGFLGFYFGEEAWLSFHSAAGAVSDKLAIPLGPAQAHLRRLCASGEVRAVVSEGDNEPELIPPSRWRSEDVDLNYALDRVGVSQSDLNHWLDQQKPPPPPPQSLGEGPTFRGDINGPWEWEFYGERWFRFDKAANELGDKLAIPPSAAEAKLRKLCASREIRTVGCDDPDDPDVRVEPIPPSEWPEDDLPRQEVFVSNADFYKWLNKQSAKLIAGGKQSRIARLNPLDLKTLKTAIDAYNRQLGNAGNA
jgi:hypothetical protein